MADEKKHSCPRCGYFDPNVTDFQKPELEGKADATVTVILDGKEVQVLSSAIVAPAVSVTEQKAPLSQGAAPAEAEKTSATDGKIEPAMEDKSDPRVEDKTEIVAEDKAGPELVNS